MGQFAHWLMAARNGSRDALGQAMEACRGYLLVLARRELDPGLRPKGSASDLVQETLLEAHKDFGQFHGNTEEELRAWLRQLLLHNLANFTRRYRNTAKREVAREVPVQLDRSSANRGGGLAADAPSPSGLAIEREQTEALERALNRLPEDYRRVILLRHQEQRSFEDIAQLMQRSSNAVRTLWSRAIRRLRREMEVPHEPG